MSSNAQKTLTDAGYIAIGLGVMGFQQAQARARAARERVNEVGGCVTGHAREFRTTLDTKTQTTRNQAETQVRNSVARAGEQANALRDGVGKRVEPVVGQLQAQLGDFPERVVQAMEPFAARVRVIAGTAA
jgi:ABC-type sugar transport system substrate-binding protein